jgi:hypothetical protein
MRIVEVELMSGRNWPVFTSGRDDDLGWTAECPELGIIARGATWSELTQNCARAMDAVLSSVDEPGLAELGFSIAGYSAAPGHGTHWDLPFNLRTKESPSSAHHPLRSGA